LTASALETRALRKQYGDTVAVADLSLSVAPGEVFGFLGPNGAGKTTSVKMLLGLVAPTSGSGTLLGEPLGTTRARARVGFLPEHFRFHDSLTARELLRVHGRLYGMRGLPLESRIEMLLSRVGMLDAADRPLRGYSKGMTQRAGLAQALLNDPEVVFLDEPTSGLDPLGRLLVRDVIAELRARGAAVFLNSHLLGEVEATCDRVAFVKEGRVVQELALRGAAADVEVEIRLSAVDAGVIDGLAALAADVVQVSADRVRLRVADEDRLPEIARWLVGTGRDVYTIAAHRKSLEEWFVDVVGGEQGPG
jgi:ABC-2 type transport system ATP-binding protein